MQKGFTLLEMLLVLAVIALIASSGLASYQQRVTGFKVEQTALKMQAILEAAQAYHANPPSASADQWPLCDGSGEACPDPAVNDFISYMGGTPLHNSPWYSATVQSFFPYTTDHATPKPNPCFSSETEQPEYSLNFTVPSTQSNAAAIAQEIAARLPSATVNPDGVLDNCPANTVVATAVGLQLPTPPLSPGSVAGIYTFHGMALDSAGHTQSTQIHLKNACPSNSTQMVYFAATDFTTSDYNSPPNQGYGKVSNFYIVKGASSPTGTFENPVANPGALVYAEIEAQIGYSPFYAYPTQNGTGLAIEYCKAND